MPEENRITTEGTEDTEKNNLQINHRDTEAPRSVTLFRVADPIELFLTAIRFALHTELKAV
jgi:hypothetical protein